MNPIVGFSPDAQKTAPGMLTDCSHVIPYEAGYKGAPLGIAANADALATECRGAVVSTRLDGTRRIFAGTQTNLYELTGTTWTDRSAAGAYVGSSESRWSFCQFGDTTIASNLSDAMQSSTAAAFAAITSAPKAKIVLSASNNFVMALNVNGGSLGIAPDGWWCSAQNNQTDWTPNVSTGSTNGRLIGVEGPIQAGLTLGDYVVAYKQRAIFLGRFVGAPVGFQWNLVPGGEAGTVGQEAVCDIGGAHFIVGNDNFWLFDGTRPVPIGIGQTRQWFLQNSNPTYRYRTKAIYDKQNNIVRVHYPSLNSSNGVCDASLIYHVLKKEWGCDDYAIEAPLNYIAPGVTINGMDAYAATIDTLPNIPVDSQFWLSGGQTPAYFSTSHRLMSLNGATAASSMTTGDIGDDDVVTMMDRFRIRYENSPLTATGTGQFKFNEGDALINGPTNAINDGKFDLRQSGRFHRVRIDMTGDHKEYAFDARIKQAGGR